MMRRAWNAIVLWCEELVFALCIAVDGEEWPYEDDEIVDESICGTHLAPPG
jgi:hypothetical protein